MKAFFDKVSSWIKEHKTQSIIILVATVLAVSCAIAIPLGVKASKKQKSEETSQVIKNGRTLTVLSEDTSKGVVSGGGTYKSGTSVIITATPNSGYKFEGWYIDETKVSPEPTYTVSVSSDVTYVAKFIAQEFTLTIKDEADPIYILRTLSVGKPVVVKADRTYEYSIPAGQSVTLMVDINPIAPSGSVFDGWFEGESFLSSSLTYTYTMPAKNVTLTLRAHATAH